MDIPGTNDTLLRHETSQRYGKGLNGLLAAAYEDGATRPITPLEVERAARVLHGTLDGDTRWEDATPPERERCRNLARDMADAMRGTTPTGNPTPATTDTADTDTHSNEEGNTTMANTTDTTGNGRNTGMNDDTTTPTTGTTPSARHQRAIIDIETGRLLNVPPSSSMATAYRLGAARTPTAVEVEKAARVLWESLYEEAWADVDEDMRGVMRSRVRAITDVMRDTMLGIDTRA